MNIIARLSFWIMKPKKQQKKSIPGTTRLLFRDLILDALAQFRTEGYVEKLQTSITPESLPSNEDDLLEFLYHQIAHT